MNFKKDSVNPIMLLIENLGEISILADEVVDNPDVISDNQEREILTDIYGKFMKENMELIIEITKSSGQEEGYKNVEEISKFFYKRLNKLKTDAVVKRQEKKYSSNTESKTTKWTKATKTYGISRRNNAKKRM